MKMELRITLQDAWIMLDLLLADAGSFVIYCYSKPGSGSALWQQQSFCETLKHELLLNRMKLRKP